VSVANGSAVAPGREGALPSSFRDPSGFLFRRDGILYRQVNRSCAEAFDRLTSSGLYAALTDEGLLIPHQNADPALALTDAAYKVIRPRLVPFVSYPYEWCFSQLKDAALLTLAVQRRALEHGMSLKDASAYNVQFVDARPVAIDTLSFEPYPEGRPWVAYGQFCRHFLAPLALMSRTDVRLGQLLRIHIDGIPLDLASALLPVRTRWTPSLGVHVHMHARARKKYVEPAAVGERARRPFGRNAFLGLLDSLRAAVANLDWEPGGTEWHDYYVANHNYGEAGLAEKERLVGRLLERVHPETVWDLGANTGRFSRIAARQGARVVAWDVDPACVEAHYRTLRAEDETGILPLLVDLTNPSPDMGWHGRERGGFLGRAPADAVLALGLIHHLAIANNVPLERVADFLGALCRNLIVEFVPKEDSQVQRLLASREDVFPGYTAEGFEAAFAPRFDLVEAAPIPDTRRTLFLMRRRDQEV
jgi:SAM-dependent methyltransferase